MGCILFGEGDRGTVMYSVLKGRVALRKGDEETGVIPAGTCFDEVSFLLSSKRVETASALDDVELEQSAIRISTI